MIIGIDASRANKPQKTGTEWYSYHLIRTLAEIDKENQYKLYLNKSVEEGLKNLGSNFKEKVLKWPPVRLWTQFRLSFEMLRQSPDVLFIPAHVLPLIMPKKSVVTIHDIGFEKHPELYSWKDIWYHKWAIYWAKKKASKIITISEYSKNDLIEKYKIDPEKIKVIHLGYDNDLYKLVDDQGKILSVLNKYVISRPYLLFIGRLEQKKNVLGLIEAFNILKKLGEYKDLKLVLVGRPGYKFGSIEEKIKEYGLENSVLVLGWVPQKDLAYLLNGAEAFVLPSFFEGFGLPILEAMACGTPVLASNRASIPEVAGGAAELFDPKNTEDMVNSIKKVLSNKEHKEELIEKGLERVKNFSWQKCSRETLKVLKS